MKSQANLEWHFQLNMKTFSLSQKHFSSSGTKHPSGIPSMSFFSEIDTENQHSRTQARNNHLLAEKNLKTQSRFIHNKWRFFTRSLNVLYLEAVAWRRQHVDFCSLASLIFEWGWRSSHKSETLSFKINITHQLVREMIGSLSVAQLINFLLSISLIETFIFF